MCCIGPAKWIVPLLLLFVLVGCRAQGERPPTQAPSERPASQRPAPIPLASPTRAVWVARFHYGDAASVREVIARCGEAGFNTVLWQVRGEGTVLYPSALEPWAREYDHRDPGFDPLALAIDECHRRGMRIEAWLNVMPGWKGPKPPVIASQLWNARPDWFLCDAAGRRQPLGDFYLILNPALPEVRQHIRAVCDELLRHYDLDGLHMDYIRYAWDTERGARDRYMRDARTVDLFTRETGKQPDDDPAAWDGWRANQITRLVLDLRILVDQRRPGATLTAAVKPTPQDGYRGSLQNALPWLRTGVLDAAYPMAYTEKLAEFRKDVESYRGQAQGARVIPGVGIYKHDSDAEMRAQLNLCRELGGDFSLFSYAALYPTVEDRAHPAGPREAQLRSMRRSVLAEFR